MFEKDAEKSFMCKKVLYKWETDKRSYIGGFSDGAEFGYNKAKEEHKGKCKIAYIKGIRTMANALKDYDKTDGAWTDYFEHTVDKVLKKLLGQDISQEAYKELCENYSSNKSLYTDGFSDGYKECQKEHKWHYEGTPDTTHKTCIVYVDYLPNIMLCFWNGEVWIEPRTLGRFKKVKAWKYVDFPQELNNGKERT